MSKQHAKVLIVGPSWVGDMVMAQSLCIDLKSFNPDIEIHMLAPAWTAALVDRMPEVTSLIAVDFKHGELGLLKRWRLARSLATQGFTQAIVLPNSLKAALVPWLAGIPQRTGWLGEQRFLLLNDYRRLDKNAWPMTVQRFVALGLPEGAAVRPRDDIPAPALKAEQSEVERLRKKLGLLENKSVLALCPGAEFGASKQWPIAHYAEVASQYLAKDWSVWLLGSANDAQSCAEINRLVGGQAKELAGKTSLPEVVDLLSAANLVVSNDSGLMHIAAALQIPLVAVYGSTDPGHTPPLSPNHKIAWLALECSPCFARECPLEHLNCLHQLSPDQVIADAEQVLSGAVSKTSGART